VGPQGDSAPWEPRPSKPASKDDENSQRFEKWPWRAHTARFSKPPDCVFNFARCELDVQAQNLDRGDPHTGLWERPQSSLKRCTRADPLNIMWRPEVLQELASLPEASIWYVPASRCSKQNPEGCRYPVPPPTCMFRVPPHIHTPPCEICPTFSETNEPV